MKKQTKIFLLTAALAIGLSTPAWAANVPVTLPNFPVTLNGTVIENSYRQYPLLVYKNITYFPITYYDCRFLGVETEWTQAAGLKIGKGNLTGAYHQQNSSKKNGSSATAQLATGKITVNGKNINNGSEQYPLLVYRDVTYFPLTWRFAVNEFGWNYNFTNQTGLTIDATNIKTSSITLNDSRTNFSFTADRNYLYYQGEKGAIYRRPLSALTDDRQRRTLMTVDMNYVYDDYALGNLYMEGGHVYLRYYVGGATMGSYQQYRLDGNSAEKVLSNKSRYYDFGDFQIIASEFVGWPDPTKLEYSDRNGTKKQLGEDNYYYRAGGFKMGYNGDSTSFGESCIDVWNNQLYTVAFKNDEKDQSHICKVDLKTGKTTVLSQHPTDSFQLADGMIYFLSYYKSDGTMDTNRSQQYLYALDLSTNKEQYIGYVGNDLYAAAKNGVYYREHITSSLLFWSKYTKKMETMNAGFKLTQLYRQNDCVIAHFEEIPKNPYRLLVFAPSGQTMQQVYASADRSDQAVINPNGLLLYRLEGSKQVVQVQL